MSPSFTMLLDKFPMNLSGKIDQSALPDPTTLTEVNVESKTKGEQEVENICKQLLGLKYIPKNINLNDIGANSLILTKLAVRLSKKHKKEISLKKIFESPTISDVTQLLNKTPGVRSFNGPVNLGDNKFPAPLTYQQEQIWFLIKYSPKSIAYNTNFTIHINGSINIKLLEQALTLLVNRQKIFRTKFIEHGGVLFQELVDPWKVSIEQKDFTHFDENQDEIVDAEIMKDLNHVFDVSNPPLLFWKLYRIRSNKYILLQVEHHFVHDGWSLTILMKELIHTYRSLMLNQNPNLEPILLDYADYAHWQRSPENTKRLDKQLSYWLDRLKNAPTETTFPLDKCRPKQQKFNGKLMRFDLKQETYDKLRRFSKDNSISLYNIMFSAYILLLKLYSRSSDFIVGAGFANRKYEEVESIIGMMVNTLALRVKLNRNDTVKNLLRSVQLLLVEAHENQDVPVEKIINKLCN
jgi:NRPS condensation-like uncharacterized protein/acyl carrier protein